MESEAIILALAALAQSTRLDAFRLLVRHEPKGLAAGNIAKAVAVPQSTMSSHLALLSRAGLVSARRSSRSTAAILVVLIAVFGPISGAHFNPAVTLVFRLGGELSTSDALMYSLVQIIGGIVGTMIAHLMFGLPLLNEAMKIRTGGAQWFAEAVALFGLIVTSLVGLRFERGSVPWLVGLYMTAAYWFTASTSFANPAVAVARSLTNTFSGIRPRDLPGFVTAEFCGAIIVVIGWLLREVNAAAPIRKEVQL